MKDLRGKDIYLRKKANLTRVRASCMLLVQCSCVKQTKNRNKKKHECFLINLNFKKIYIYIYLWNNYKIFVQWLANVYAESLVWDDVLYKPIPNY